MTYNYAKHLQVMDSLNKCLDNLPKDERYVLEALIIEYARNCQARALERYKQSVD